MTENLAEEEGVEQQAGLLGSALRLTTVMYAAAAPTTPIPATASTRCWIDHVCALRSKTSTVMMPTINIGKTKKKTALPAVSPGSRGTTSTNCGGDVRASSEVR